MTSIRAGMAAVAAASIALLALIVQPAASARAAPSPRDEEWWFSAWAIQNKIWPVTTGRGITIAVVDSGVNASLPELHESVLPGTDATNQGLGDGRRDTDQDLGGHGTAMAALIAGQGGPSGMVGVLPDSKILPIVTDGFSSSEARAIRFAVSHGVQAINFSQASPDIPGQRCPSDLQEAIVDAVQKNVVIVASAGNEGAEANLPQFPASCAGVLAVGAVDSHLRAWPNTQRQSYVAAAAPGWGVGSINKQGVFVNDLSGTSQAAALTSAAAAILRARYPNLPARDLVQRLINTTVDAGPHGRDNQTGSGAVVPSLALTKSVPKNAPNPPFERLDRWLATHKASGGEPTSAPSAPSTQEAGTGSANPSAAAGGTASSSSSSGLGIAFGLGIAAVVVVAACLVLIMRWRGGRQRRVAGPPPFPNQQPWPQPGPGYPPQNPPWQGQSPKQADPPTWYPPPDSWP